MVKSSEMALAATTLALLGGAPRPARFASERKGTCVLCGSPIVPPCGTREIKGKGTAHGKCAMEADARKAAGVPEPVVVPGGAGSQG